MKRIKKEGSKQTQKRQISEGYWKEDDKSEHHIGVGPQGVVPSLKLKMFICRVQGDKPDPSVKVIAKKYNL